MHAQSHMAISADGIPIHCDVHGSGVIALVFVHGWCCDRHYWDPQVEHFAPRYTVVCLDLAGHGASGRDRTQWTVPAFGQDIVAVVEQLGLEQVVLIGHSSGGRSIVEAARRLPTAVIGLVSVDTCMDARLMVDQILGLQTGDAHIIRNAGGIVTEDALRSLILSHHLLGTQEFMIINHTDCGMLTFKDEDVRVRLHQLTGTATVAPVHFHAFSNVEENVRQQIQKVTSHPWIPKQMPVRGFVYDVKTGRLQEVAT